MRKLLLRSIARLRGACAGPDDSVSREMAAHLDMAADEYVRRGMTPGDARRAARLDAGGLDAAAEAYRDQQSVPIIERIRRDIGFALRGLRRNRRFAAGIVASLTLGIGLNTAIFTVVDEVLGRPLPLANADRLVIAGTTVIGEAGAKVDFMSYGRTVDAWRQARTLDGTAVIAPTYHVVAGDASPEYATGASATADLLRVIGAHPARGRWFATGEMHQPVVVLGDEMWRHQFASDPRAVGRTLRVDGVARTVIGVMPRGVGLPLGAKYWLPMEDLAGQVIGLRRPGISLQSIDAELTALSPMVPLYRRSGQTLDVVVMPLHEQLFGPARPALGLLLGAAGLLLLITCANVANLSLARVLTRRREFALRVALGASRGAIGALLVVENLLMAIAGCALGVLLAFGAADALVALAPPSIVVAGRIRLHGAEIVFASGLALLACLIVSLAPVISAMRAGTLAATANAKAGMGRGVRRLRHALVAAQLATTLVLMIGAGLLIRSVQRLTRPDHLGFSPAGVVVLNVSPFGEQYHERGARQAFSRHLVERLRGLPGVTEVSVGPAPLVSGTGDFGYRDGFNAMFTWSGLPRSPAGPRVATPGESAHTVWVKNVDPDYRSTFGIRLASGRWFTAADDSSAAPVALLNRAAARLFFGDVDPVGRLLEGTFLSRNAPAPAVVGVVDDVLQRDLALDANAEVFLPVAQQPSGAMSAIAVKSSAPPAVTIAEIQRTIRSVDPALAPTRLEPMESVVAASLARYTFVRRLLTLFASLGLVLAMIGLYAVVSYLVAQRTTEIGVRLALGAPRRHVFGIVLGEAAALAAIGVAVGIPLALALARMLSTFLYGVSSNDLVAIGSGSAILGLVAVAAAWAPARRASGLDPAATLRTD